MQKSLYDHSALTWSPQGRLYQVEYAMEAVNQGKLLLGLKSDNAVVLVGFKSSQSETLSYYPEKLFKIDSHLGMGIAGLTPDGRLLYQFMKNECLNYNYTFNSNYPVERLVIKISEKSQVKTQRGESKRPYGVGLLIAGFDESGPRLFRTCPSANYYEYKCVAIGARSQGATTFLENHMEKFKTMDNKQLVLHGLRAMKKAQDVAVNGKNLDVLIVGKDCETKIYNEQEIEALLKEEENLMDIN
ncbi:MAG: proteasome subunit alpha [archaeon]|nr:proteasome subunit alpha [archaeon]